MALDADGLRYLRTRLGSSPSDADIDVLYAVYEDDYAHPLEHVVLQVFEERYADMLRNPASFSVAGEYSQSTAANLEALRKEIARQRAYMISLDIDLDGPPTGDAMTIVSAADRTVIR